MMNLMYIIPKNLLSWLVGFLVHLRLPEPLKSISMQWFARRYKLNLAEAEKELKEYKSIGDLFVRQLKPGFRPINGDLIHPVDAKLTIFGKIESDQLIQAKGITYSLNQFLGEESASEEFLGGHYLTYYLCPTDYHRVHSPVSGPITGVNYIPGFLWPVNDWSVSRIKQLFSVNERVVIWINSQWGRVGYVMVGATNVGRMTLSFDQNIITNKNPFKAQRQDVTYEPPLENKVGDELGAFNMGSTVIVIYPKAAPINLNSIQSGPTQLGELLQKLPLTELF